MSHVSMIFFYLLRFSLAIIRPPNRDFGCQFYASADDDVVTTGLAKVRNCCGKYVVVTSNTAPVTNNCFVFLRSSKSELPPDTPRTSTQSEESKASSDHNQIRSRFRS